MMARREVIADQMAPQVEQAAKAHPPNDRGRSQEKHRHGHHSWNGDNKLTSENNVLRIVKERAQAEQSQRGGRDGEDKTSTETK